MGALHRVGDALGSIDQLVSHVLVLLHRLVVIRMGDVPLLTYWLLLLDGLARRILLHDVDLVAKLAIFAGLKSWPSATTISNALDAAHLACHGGVLGEVS